MNRRTHLSCLLFCLGGMAWVSGSTAAWAETSAAPGGSGPAYRSPSQLAVSPDGSRVYVADETGRRLTVLDAQQQKKLSDIPLAGAPRALCLSEDGRQLYVAERTAGTVAVIDTASGRVTGRLEAGRWPVALALAPKSGRLWVGNQDNATVSVLDLSREPARKLKDVAVVREPVSIAVTPDEKRVLVANFLPYGVGTDPTLAAAVSVIDAEAMQQVAVIKLPSGSTLVNSICLSPDGRWAYAVHSLARFNLPITQLERGWVNTYALSVMDVQKSQLLATVLLDNLTQGAANPHSVICSSDGDTLWVSHAGVHLISIIDLRLLHDLLAGKVPESLAALKDGTQDNIWVRVQKDPATIAELANDLTALYIAGAIRRAPCGGLGPRGLALAGGERQLYAANYYSGQVALLDADSGKELAMISLGEQPEADAVRRGEIYFHDATNCFQHWHSCASCHPNQGRVDGLRWDFLRDGIGNGKDTLNLVYVQETEPLNRKATRENAMVGSRTGIQGAYFVVPTEQEVQDVYEYFLSLRPEASPFLARNDQLSAAAQRGRLLFEGKANCAGCHPAPFFTDQKTHNVGAISPNEEPGYDTPSLIEAHRTGPYLHDGRAATLKDALTVHDPEGKHGKTIDLTPTEVDDLVAYLLSL